MIGVIAALPREVAGLVRGIGIVKLSALFWVRLWNRSYATKK